MGYPIILIWETLQPRTRAREEGKSRGKQTATDSAMNVAFVVGNHLDMWDMEG